MIISTHPKKKKKKVANIFNVTSSPDLSECFCFMPRFPILRPTLCPLTLLCPPPPLCPSLPLLQCFNFYFTCHLSVSTFPFCSCDLHQNNQYQSSYSPSHIGLCLHVEQQGWFPGTKCLVIWQKCLWRLHRPFWCHLDNWPFDFQFSIFCPQSSSVTSYEALIGQLVDHILKSKSVRLLPKQTHVIFSNGSPHFQINRVKLKSKNPKNDSKFPRNI